MIEESPHSCACARPGRPRAFDRGEALRVALELFWRRGYEQTSLEELTAAMGISRSSFYACFESKHGLLLAAVDRYCDDSFEALRQVAGEAGDPARAAQALVFAIADPEGGRRGCFLANCVTELAPHDREVEALTRGQLERIQVLLAGILAGASGAEGAAARAAALLSLALGATMLRKAGTSPEQIRALLAESGRLVAPSG